MRIAAGVLMLIAGTIGIIFLPVYLIASPWGLLAVPWVGIVIAGGIFSLQRKHWILCLVASILTLGIIPIIFVALRKNEWKS